MFIDTRRLVQLQEGSVERLVSMIHEWVSAQEDLGESSVPIATFGDRFICVTKDGAAKTYWFTESNGELIITRVESEDLTLTKVQFGKQVVESLALATELVAEGRITEAASLITTFSGDLAEDAKQSYAESLVSSAASMPGKKTGWGLRLAESSSKLFFEGHLAGEPDLGQYTLCMEDSVPGIRHISIIAQKLSEMVASDKLLEVADVKELADDLEGFRSCVSEAVKFSPYLAQTSVDRFFSVASDTMKSMIRAYSAIAAGGELK